MKGTSQQLNDYWEQVRPSQSRMDGGYILDHREAALYGISIVNAESRQAFDEAEEIEDIANAARADFVGLGIP